MQYSYGRGEGSPSGAEGAELGGGATRSRRLCPHKGGPLEPVYREGVGDSRTALQSRVSSKGLSG